jgi:hypothetical protein
LHAAVVDRWPGVRVRRCSHTGGHRFAPTGITFPDGRAWAYLTEDVLDRVVARSGTTRSLVPHYRGALALPAPAQVAERALWDRVGWSVFGGAVAATADGADGGPVHLVWDVPGSAGEAHATVAVRRMVPVPPCGSAPDGSTKREPEWELVDLAGVDGTVSGPGRRSPPGG